jgi:hypothetical protein
MTGTLDQIGADINQIKAMGLEHSIWICLSQLAQDMKKMVDITKQLARFAK